MFNKNRSKSNVARVSINKCIPYMILLSIISIYLFNLGFHHVLGDKSETFTSIAQAEDSVITAYLSVLEIEEKGGDVSELLIRLNDVLDKLAEAEIAFESGNYDLALELANSVIEVSDNISIMRTRLSLLAQVQKENEFARKLQLSIGLVCVIVLSGYLGWMGFKKYYLRRQMDSRMEVLYDESR
jgi:hypothetical protein